MILCPMCRRIRITDAINDNDQKELWGRPVKPPRFRKLKQRVPAQYDMIDTAEEQLCPLCRKQGDRAGLEQQALAELTLEQRIVASKITQALMRVPHEKRRAAIVEAAKTLRIKLPT